MLATIKAQARHSTCYRDHSPRVVIRQPIPTRLGPLTHILEVLGGTLASYLAAFQSSVVASLGPFDLSSFSSLTLDFHKCSHAMQHSALVPHNFVEMQVISRMASVPSTFVLAECMIYEVQYPTNPTLEITISDNALQPHM